MPLNFVRQLRSAVAVLSSEQFQQTLQNMRESDLLAGDVFAANQIADAQRAISRVRKVVRSLDRLMALHTVKPSQKGG